MNLFNGREKKLNPNELRLVEQKLSIQLPDDLKEHYLQYNGGTPTDRFCFDTIGNADPVEVRRFFPIRYCRAQADDPEFTLEGFARREWASQRLPRNFLPFADDVLGNTLCVDRTSGSVCYIDLARWHDDRSPQENWVAMARDVARSFASFLLNLKPPARHATVPEPVAVVAPPPLSLNIFTQCERPMMEWDFALAESQLQITLPAPFRSHYFRYNGGIPRQTMWVDGVDRLEVAHFFPLLLPPGQREDAVMTVTGCTRQLWNQGALPRSLLVFAVDVAGDFFCLNYLTGEVRFVVRPMDGGLLRLEKVREPDLRFVAASLPHFVEGLRAED